MAGAELAAIVTAEEAEVVPFASEIAVTVIADPGAVAGA
jgi:hypothetical protein